MIVTCKWTETKVVVVYVLVNSANKVSCETGMLAIPTTALACVENVSS